MVLTTFEHCMQQLAKDIFKQFEAYFCLITSDGDGHLN